MHFSDPNSESVGIAARCPECPHSVLVESHSDLGESNCPTCSLAQLDPDAGKKLFSDILRMSSTTVEQLASGGSEGHRCWSCGGGTRVLKLRGTSPTWCWGCGAMTFKGGGLYSVTLGRFGRQAPWSATQKQVTVLRETGATKTLAFVSIAVVITGAAGYATLDWLKARTTATQAKVEAAQEPESVLAANAPPTINESPPIVPGTPAAPAHVDLVADFVFGGRRIAWWAKRLEALKAKPGAEAARLYALTKRRAEANGLLVDDTRSPIQVTPSAQLIAEIAERSR
jgi:hypothetical protein